jgi:S1-C subfamily serine protease
VRRGLLGVAGSNATLDRRLVLAWSLGQDTGVRVESVEPGSPAELARLQAGDLILGLDGIAITSVDALHQALGSERVGRDVLLKVLRAGGRSEPLYLTVRPTEARAG